MTYSCTDFTDDVLNLLVSCGEIAAAEIPDDDPQAHAELAVQAIVKMHRCVRASQFVRELLAAVESVSAIAEEHGVGVLSIFFYLQSAIANDTYVEVNAAERGAVSLLLTLPAAAEWMKYVRTVDAV